MPFLLCAAVLLTLAFCFWLASKALTQGPKALYALAAVFTAIGGLAAAVAACLQPFMG